MLTADTLVKVTNRDNGTVGYTIPDGKYDIREIFQRNETKEIPFEELKKLTYQPGGTYLLEHFLRIDNKEVIEALLGEVEPEYHYTEEDIKKLLLFGSVDELKDCIDFGPEGVIDIIKELAVKLELNDINKREAILELTGFDVNTAVSINKATQDVTTDTKPKRRTETKIEEKVVEAKPARRAGIPKYEESNK